MFSQDVRVSFCTVFRWYSERWYFVGISTVAITSRLLQAPIRSTNDTTKDTSTIPNFYNRHVLLRLILIMISGKLVFLSATYATITRCCYLLGFYCGMTLAFAYHPQRYYQMNDFYSKDQCAKASLKRLFIS